MGHKIKQDFDTYSSLIKNIHLKDRKLKGQTVKFGKGSGRVAAGAAGALLGAFLGNQIGLSLDRADRLAMQKTTTTALETSKSGTAVAWRNPDTGNRGTVTPKPAFKNNNGRYCREFQQTVTIGGRTAEAYGTACRQPDGSWKIVR